MANRELDVIIFTLVKCTMKALLLVSIWLVIAMKVAALYYDFRQSPMMKSTRHCLIC